MKPIVTTFLKRPLQARSSRRIAAACSVLLLTCAAGCADDEIAQTDAKNWGSITAPVFGTEQKGIYANSELFAGPDQFDGDYYHGVLPNGRIVRPAGVSVQVGNVGYPVTVSPLINFGDVDSKTQGLGQTYFMNLPILAVLGGTNPGGEPRLDRNYPGYNFNISDQRRAKEFCADFDRMVKSGTLPQFLYIYQPNDHTGSTQATNVPQPTAAQQVGDGDVALGMVIEHIMKSPIYYDSKSGLFRNCHNCVLVIP